MLEKKLIINKRIKNLNLFKNKMFYYNKKMSDTEEPVVSEEPEEPVVSEGSEEPAVTEVVEDVVPEEPSEPVVEAPEEHAVTTAWFGPLKPYFMDICPEARFIRQEGMKNGVTLFGPFSNKVIEV